VRQILRQSLPQIVGETKSSASRSLPGELNGAYDVSPCSSSFDPAALSAGHAKMLILQSEQKCRRLSRNQTCREEKFVVGINAPQHHACSALVLAPCRELFAFTALHSNRDNRIATDAVR